MENFRNCATCYFLDVGQGASQVVHLGKRRAIIIDTGDHKSSNPLLSLLGTLGIETIPAFILSHNDKDHIGEAEMVIDRYRKQIGKLFFLDDRPCDKNNVYKIVCAAIEKKYITRKNIVRLETNDGVNIFDENGVRITVLYPDVLANIASDGNSTCAIIAISVGSQNNIRQRIVFSGDAPISAWKQILQNSNDHNKRLKVPILTMPHHGGKFTDNENEVECFF